MESLSPLEQEINAHTRRLTEEGIACGVERCPKCRGIPGACTLHAYRKRIFLVLAGRIVRALASLLACWKCPLCGATFTEYPPFALPHKHYAVPSDSPTSPLAASDSASLTDRGRRYLEDDRMSYRKAVLAGGELVRYESRPEKIDDRTLSHATLWRWVGFLGRREEIARHLLGQVRQKDPASPIFRRLPLLQAAPQKYRSEPRRILLEAGLRLFAALAEFARLFPAPIFPRLWNGLLFQPA